MNARDLHQRCAKVDFGAQVGEFALRRLEVDRDLTLMHGWMNDPPVARYWQKGWERDRVRSYLLDQDHSAHSTPYLGLLNGTPMSYWELYRADLDPLAGHYAAREHDLGVHLLLGPTEHRGRGLAAELLHTVSNWQLDADPRSPRVVAEPDVGNLRSIRTFERAGFHRAGELDLPGKRAVLMVRDRPDDHPQQVVDLHRMDVGGGSPHAGAS